ncbi:hypothetical protein CORC01_13481 [Colletotrichum orchidophilum]|uniref:Uncharacterized protein n=1 Tax=Colletotrichum orchidophilum TaxID=1209926 RepID=A0A1G4APV8_9PEZI|nr:uncharacterized protein CORC01_13481 [Colletotrichum orchidophilum]OHE91204.1 hypothetical protein CORC01_13481 [Colletotrichum orchidophilum]
MSVEPSAFKGRLTPDSDAECQSTSISIKFHVHIEKSHDEPLRGPALHTPAQRLDCSRIVPSRVSIAKHVRVRYSALHGARDLEAGM